MKGSLVTPVIVIVVVYLILKFVVPNIPGSAPLPSSVIILYMMLTIVGDWDLLHTEQRIQRCLLGSDGTVSDGREYWRNAGVALRRPDSVPSARRLANL